MRASSSLILGDDEVRLDEMNGCSTIRLVGVCNSMSRGFVGDVDEGKSKLEPSPVVESGRLLAY